MIFPRSLALLALGLGAATTVFAQRSTTTQTECTAGGATCPPLIPAVPTARPFACTTGFGDAQFVGDAPVGNGPITLVQCAQLASSEPAFDWQPAVPGDFAGTGACFSDQEVIVLNEVPCTDPNAILVYYFDQGPAPSLLPRRKRDILRQLAAARDVSICPQGLTACRVENSDNGFECLDTTSELESCGGCRFGLFEGPTVVDEATVFVQNARLLRGFSKRDAAPEFRRRARALTIAAEVNVGLDCSDRSLFGADMTCKQGACVPAI